MNVTPNIADIQRQATPNGTLSPHPARERKSTAGLTARLALDERTRRDAYRLRHLCYHANGHIDARDDGEFSDRFDRVGANRTVVIYEGERPIASVRVCCADPSSTDPATTDLPLAQVFPDEIATLRRTAPKILELNRLVRHPDYAHNQGLVFILFRMADFLIRSHDPDMVASCVRTNHVGFYKRMRFEYVAGPKLYTGLNFTTNLLVCRKSVSDEVRRSVPVLQIDQQAGQRYRGMLDGQAIAVFDDD